MTGVPPADRPFRAGLAGLQPLYEQLALAAGDLPTKAGRRDRDREQIACTGTPEAPGTPRPGDSPR